MEMMIKTGCEFTEADCASLVAKVNAVGVSTMACSLFTDDGEVSTIPWHQLPCTVHSWLNGATMDIYTMKLFSLLNKHQLCNLIGHFMLL